MTQFEERIRYVEERLRCNFAYHYGNLLYETGAIVLEDHEFINCLNGFLFQAAREYGDETLNYIDFKIYFPFVQVKKKKEISWRLKQTLNEFYSLSDVIRGKSDFKKFKDESINLLTSFDENYTKWEERQYTTDNTKMDIFKDMAEKNLNKIKYTVKVIIFFV
jgi:hypothetical protein